MSLASSHHSQVKLGNVATRVWRWRVVCATTYLQKKLIQYLLFYQRVQISNENSPIGIADITWHRHTACQKYWNELRVEIFTDLVSVADCASDAIECRKNSWGCCDGDVHYCSARGRPSTECLNSLWVAKFSKNLLDILSVSLFLLYL